jgi:hypothetical protein
VEDWVEQNFNFLTAMGMLKRSGENYQLTERGYTQAIKELCLDRFIDFDMLQTEIEAGQREAADSRIRVSVRAWMRKHRKLAGTPKHILLDFLQGAVLND